LAGGVVQQRLFIELGADLVPHRVLLDLGLCVLQFPGWVVDLAAQDPTLAVECVKAIALGEPGVE
jgi:hypothetical protein